MYQFRPDGEGGFPGTLTAQVTYDLTEDNALKIDYLLRHRELCWHH